MSKLRKQFEVIEHLKRNKSKYNNVSVPKVCGEIETLFDVTYSRYRMQTFMEAAGVALNRHARTSVRKTSLTNLKESSEIKDQLDHMEKKLDFVCDFIQYAKSGEVPQ
jgi:transposase|tara:strand:- start:9880 stop:10203 length:324 start_codon:yes stop_codon:yes gene_type:complete